MLSAAGLSSLPSPIAATSSLAAAAAFSLADAFVCSEAVLLSAAPPAFMPVADASTLATFIEPVRAPLVERAALRGRLDQDAMASAAPLVLTNLIELSLGDYGVCIRRVEPFVPDDGVNEATWTERKRLLAAHLQDAGKRGLIFAVEYGGGVTERGLTIEGLMLSASGTPSDFIFSAARVAGTEHPRPTKTAMAMAIALGVQIGDLLPNETSGLPATLIYLDEIPCRLRNEPVRLCRALLPFLFVSRCDRSGDAGGKLGVKCRRWAAGGRHRECDATRAANCALAPASAFYERQDSALPWSACGETGGLADASTETGAAAIDVLHAYTDEGGRVPPPRSEAVVERATALAVCGDAAGVVSLLHAERPQVSLAVQPLSLDIESSAPSSALTSAFAGAAAASAFGTDFRPLPAHADLPEGAVAHGPPAARAAPADTASAARKRACSPPP